MSDRDARTVYSTGKGRTCPVCGWPATDCKCSNTSRGDEPVPARVVARIRVEKAGRGGKTVTVIYGLPRNAAFLKDLSKELKGACGTGGTSTEDGVELQGDQRERVRDYLHKKGYGVKG